MQTKPGRLFHHHHLPPGNYELVAEKQGFRTYRETGIRAEIGQDMRSDLKLTVGAVTIRSASPRRSLLSTPRMVDQGDVSPSGNPGMP